MKKFKIIYILVFLILSISCIYTGYQYNSWIEETRGINAQSYEAECINDNELHSEEWCSNRKELSNYTQSFYEVLTEFFSYKLINGFVLVILMILPSSFFICRYFNSKILLMETERKKYKNIIFNIILKSQSTLFIGLIYLALILTLAYISSSGFSETTASFWGSTNNSFLFIFTFIFRNLLYIILYNNIVMLCARKNCNFIVCSLSSILVIICIECFLEIFVDLILCTTILDSGIGVIFNIINIPLFYNDYGNLLPLVFALVVCAISCILIFYNYKSKEDMVMYVESINNGGK